MEINDIVILIYGIIACFVGGQIEASGNIGNRSYSIWYRTHFLIKKQGVCKFIYYKPKHFERYTLYEVISFFWSFLCIPVYALLGILRYADWIGSEALLVSGILPMVLEYLSMFVIILINDIGSRKDEKKKFYLEEGKRATVSHARMPPIASGNKMVDKVIQYSIGKRNNAYFTVYNLWDSYYARLKEARNDPQKQNQVNLDYIEYFKNIEHLVVLKENKNGSLQLRIQKQ